MKSLSIPLVSKIPVYPEEPMCHAILAICDKVRPFDLQKLHILGMASKAPKRLGTDIVAVTRSFQIGTLVGASTPKFPPPGHRPHNRPL